MSNIIAVIRLARGEVGYYDELTNIHLTIANNTHNVLAGMNTTNLQKGVRSGRLNLVTGSLVPATKLKDGKDDVAKSKEAAIKKAEEAKAKVEAETKAKAKKAEVKAESKTEAKAEVKKASTKSKAKAETKVESKTEAKAETKKA